MSRRNRNGRPQATVPRTSSKQQQERSVHSDAQLGDRVSSRSRLDDLVDDVHRGSCTPVEDLWRLRSACLYIVAETERLIESSLLDEVLLCP